MEHWNVTRESNGVDEWHDEQRADVVVHHRIHTALFVQRAENQRGSHARNNKAHKHNEEERREASPFDVGVEGLDKLHE